MTKLIKNPAIPNPVVEVSLSSENAETEVRRRYEDGNLIILRDFRFDLDYKFLASISLDVDGPPEYRRKLKKFPMEKIKNLEPSTKDSFQRFVFDVVFGGDTGRLNQFREQAASGDRQVYALYRRLFPRYDEYKAVYTWRFTETMYENLHWDNLDTSDDFHQVRVFANLDDRPRLWCISERIDSFAARMYEELGLGQFASETPDRFAYSLNNKILGGMERTCLDPMQRHHLAFAPGEVWLCESRLVAHQIYSGYRASAAMFYVKPESMDDPELRFHARIVRLHEAKAVRQASQQA
jgi:hypothetical protein